MAKEPSPKVKYFILKEPLQEMCREVYTVVLNRQVKLDFLFGP